MNHAVISNCYVDMYRVKCAKIAGQPVEDVGHYYNYKGREFALRNIKPFLILIYLKAVCFYNKSIKDIGKLNLIVFPLYAGRKQRAYYKL